MLKILAKAPWKMTDISYILCQTYKKSLHALKAFPNFSLVCSYWKRGEKIERVSNWCSVLVFGVHRFQRHSFWMLPLIIFFQISWCYEHTNCSSQRPYCALGCQLCLKNTTQLFFTKLPFKPANCTSPLFRQSPYILVFHELPPPTPKIQIFEIFQP